MPAGKGDVLEAANAIHAAQFPHLPKVEDEAKKSGVRITAPAMADFAPPAADMLRQMGRGLEEAQVAAVQNSPKVVRLRFYASTEDAAKVHTSALKMAHAIAKRAGGLIWDEKTRELYSPEAWQARLAKPLTLLKNLPAHFWIHPYRKKGPLVRMVTFGLSKFGLPNLVVNDVAASAVGPMAGLINATAATMLRDGTLTTSGQLKVVAALVNVKVLEGAKGEARISLARGVREKGDAPGRLIEIAFPGQAVSLHERQDHTLTTLFGSSDAATVVEHGARVLAASAAAKKELLKLKPKFQQGLGAGEFLSVKAPFAFANDGTEWMWVEVTSWRGKTMRGILDNDPLHLPRLKAGAKVEVAEDSVFDYMLKRSDGTTVGNETAKLMGRKAPPSTH